MSTINNTKSKEEDYFTWYLNELEEGGFITNIKYEPKSINLFDGFSINYIKPMKRVPDKELVKKIIPSKVYTYDFKFDCTPAFMNNVILRQHFIPNKTRKGKHVCLIEVKGNHDNNNMTRLFKQNQAWVYDKYGVYVELCKVPNIFKTTFTPNRYLLTDKTLVSRKLNYKPISLEELCQKEKKVKKREQLQMLNVIN